MRIGIAGLLVLLIGLMGSASAELIAWTPDEIQTGTTEQAVYTPSHTSPWQGQDESANYWTTPMDITDEAAVWHMLMQPMTVVSTGKDSSEKKQISLKLQPDDSSMAVGVVTCESQGVHVLETRDDGWSLVECYSSSFAGTKTEAWNMLVQGYIRTANLKQAEPNSEMAMVIDKLTQRLYLFREGRLYSTLRVSTGKVEWNGKKYQPYNETRSGEFFLMSKVGGFASGNMDCAMGIRFNDGDLIHQVPSITYGNGNRDFSFCEKKLGQKASHGCIRIQRKKTPEGINMKWIWEHVKTGKSRIRIVIWEDWQGRQIPIPPDDTVLYKGGKEYHRTDHCYGVSGKKMTEFLYGELEHDAYRKLKYCGYCCPPQRKSELEAINAVYAPGGDHDELMTRLRQPYIEQMAAFRTEGTDRTE